MIIFMNLKFYYRPVRECVCNRKMLHGHYKFSEKRRFFNNKYWKTCENKYNFKSIYNYIKHYKIR